MTPLIALRGVRKSYPFGESTTEVLHGVDLTIERGEYVAIVGPSGSGKTTCLEILGAMSRATQGTYFLDGDPVHERNDDELADIRSTRMGFVFQTFNLMARMSAVRNAALPLLYAAVPRSEREERARECLKRLNLGHRLEHRPAQLSGGERQRVAIARALVNEPSVVFADEPTGNLDEATGREILAIFDELHREGRTLVVVTHSAELAARARRVVRLRDGRVVDDTRN
jgi:putative ABC transport system ATP-binding protein